MEATYLCLSSEISMKDEFCLLCVNISRATEQVTTNSWPLWRLSVDWICKSTRKKRIMKKKRKYLLGGLTQWSNGMGSCGLVGSGRGGMSCSGGGSSCSGNSSRCGGSSWSGSSSRCGGSSPGGSSCSGSIIGHGGIIRKCNWKETFQSRHLTLPQGKKKKDCPPSMDVHFSFWIHLCKCHQSFTPLLRLPSPLVSFLVAPSLVRNRAFRLSLQRAWGW